MRRPVETGQCAPWCEAIREVGRGDAVRRVLRAARQATALQKERYIRIESGAELQILLQSHEME